MPPAATSEGTFIALLQGLAHNPAARGLLDDTAILPVGGETLVITHDMMVEGVHYRADDPPADVAWKLVSVNLSDLAAKGAEPIGVLLGFALGEEAWDRAFVEGLGTALDHYGAALLGGDTVAQPKGDARALGLSAIGRSALPEPPSRAGGQAGDTLYLVGAIGDAWAGLELLNQGRSEPASLVQAYRRPLAHVTEGRALAPIVNAMMDVSDGLLIDAARLASASGLKAVIDLSALSLSPDFTAIYGTDRAARLAAATGGDDYALLFAAAPDARLPVPADRIGHLEIGAGLGLVDKGEPVALPERLGWLHQAG